MEYNNNAIDEAVKRIEALATRHRGGTHAAVLALDERVHESMEEARGTPGENSAEASRINNEGLDAQARCILEGWGLTEGEALIRKDLGLPAAGPAAARGA